MMMMMMMMIIIISNSNWTERSTIQGVIARVISKSNEREARGRFEITSAISDYSLYYTLNIEHCEGSHLSARNWRENHVGLQLWVSNYKKFKLDTCQGTHVIEHRLRDK